MRLVLASGNAKKLAEMQALLAPAGVELVTQSALGVGEAEEPYGTFVENALAKARHAAASTGLAALADDSGLCIDALGGAPGVLSARYATLHGGQKSDVENNRVVLEQLSGHVDRRGRYVCVLVAVRRADDPEPLIASGRWEGEVAEHPRGEGGFGYDPLFFLPDLHLTAAELNRVEKNRCSHRARAASDMLRLLSEVWRLG